MNREVRDYIEENLQPWRYPDEVKNLLGREKTNPINIYPNIIDYFSKFRNVSATEENVANLFEMELIGIYNNIIQSLPDSKREYMQENTAFGTCFSSDATAFVTKIKDKYAILWDFRLDDLITHPTVLYKAFTQGLIKDTSFLLLFNMSILAASQGRSCYREPVFSKYIKRDWINHVSWGISYYIIAHEIAHILLGHLEGKLIYEMKVQSTGSNKTIDISAFNISQQMEYQADVLAVDILIHGVENGVIKGYELFNSSPYDDIYQHMKWMFTIFTCADAIRKNMQLPESTTHPSSINRAEIALGYFVEKYGKEIPSLNSINEVTQKIMVASGATPAIEAENEEIFVNFIENSPLLADFYSEERYMKWLNSRE